MPISGSTASQIKGAMPSALLPGLTVWLDAKDYIQGVSPSLDSPAPRIDPGWPNRGSAPNPTIVGTSAPLIVDDSTGPNGRRYIHFWANQGRVRGTGMCTDGSYDLTVIYVGRQWGTIKGRMFSCGYPTYNILIGTHSAGEPVCYDNGWVGTQPAWGGLPTPWKQYCMTCDTQLGRAPTSHTTRFYVNGVQQAFHGSSAGHGGAWHLSGYTATGAEETCDCDVIEVLCWNRTLPPNELEQARLYLKGKFGVG